MSLETLLLIGLALVIFFRYFVKIDNRGGAPAVASRQPTTAVQSNHTWDGPGYFDFEIVGESNYQPALAALAGTHGERSPDKECQAALIPEDDNRYDDKAVRVDINGLTVGYLSRDDARSFRRRLGAKRLTGQITHCAAVIVGGYRMKNGERASYGVKLDIKPFG